MELKIKYIPLQKYMEKNNYTLNEIWQLVKGGLVIYAFIGDAKIYRGKDKSVNHEIDYTAMSDDQLSKLGLHRHPTYSNIISSSSKPEEIHHDGYVKIPFESYRGADDIHLLKYFFKNGSMKLLCVGDEEEGYSTTVNPWIDITIDDLFVSSEQIETLFSEKGKNPTDESTKERDKRYQQRTEQIYKPGLTKDDIAKQIFQEEKNSGRVPPPVDRIRRIIKIQHLKSKSK